MPSPMTKAKTVFIAFWNVDMATASNLRSCEKAVLGRPAWSISTVRWAERASVNHCVLWRSSRAWSVWVTGYASPIVTLFQFLVYTKPYLFVLFTDQNYWREPKLYNTLGRHSVTLHIALACSGKRQWRVLIGVSLVVTVLKQLDTSLHFSRTDFKYLDFSLGFLCLSVVPLAQNLDLL